MSNLQEIKAEAICVPQGKCVVQPHELAGWFMVMFPDGTVTGVRGRAKVIRECNAWARKQPLPVWGFGVLTVEWQGLGIKEVTTPLSIPIVAARKAQVQQTGKWEDAKP